MYVIEYLIHDEHNSESFNCSQVGDFFHRVKELRDNGTVITNTYFID
jgi:hypothetical protein